MSWSGPKGGLSLEEREKARRALRVKALMLVRDGVENSAICLRLNISHRTLIAWKRDAK